MQNSIEEGKEGEREGRKTSIHIRKTMLNHLKNRLQRKPQNVLQDKKNFHFRMQQRKGWEKLFKCQEMN